MNARSRPAIQKMCTCVNRAMSPKMATDGEARRKMSFGLEPSRWAGLEGYPSPPASRTRPGPRQHGGGLRGPRPFRKLPCGSMIRQATPGGDHNRQGDAQIGGAQTRGGSNASQQGGDVFGARTLPACPHSPARFSQGESGYARCSWAALRPLITSGRGRSLRAHGRRCGLAGRPGREGRGCKAPAGRAASTRGGIPCGSPIARRPRPGQAPWVKDSRAWPCYFFAS
jgi:hypothetical protein